MAAYFEDKYVVASSFLNFEDSCDLENGMLYRVLPSVCLSGSIGFFCSKRLQFTTASACADSKPTGYVNTSARTSILSLGIASPGT